MATYSIYRNYFSGQAKLLKEGLTLEEAKAYCRDPETSSTTCNAETSAQESNVQWFDSYTEE